MQKHIDQLKMIMYMSMSEECIHFSNYPYMAVHYIINTPQCDNQVLVSSWDSYYKS